MQSPSDLYRRIWNAVSRIPKGRVSTYGGIARVCGFPRHARIVGYALHSIPHGADIPWHRVINSQGRISFRKRSGSYQEQRSLLQKEGIVFARERISLSAYGWPKAKKAIH